MNGGFATECQRLEHSRRCKRPTLQRFVLIHAQRELAGLPGPFAIKHCLVTLASSGVGFQMAQITSITMQQVLRSLNVVQVLFPEGVFPDHEVELSRAALQRYAGQTPHFVLPVPALLDDTAVCVQVWHRNRHFQPDCTGFIAPEDYSTISCYAASLCSVAGRDGRAS